MPRDHAKSWWEEQRRSRPLLSGDVPEAGTVHSGASPPQSPAQQPRERPKELRSITAALPRSSEASRPPRRHGRRTSFLRCCNNWPWARWLQTARLPSHPALGVGSLKSEVLDQNHILAPGLQSPLPPFSPPPQPHIPAPSMQPSSRSASASGSSPPPPPS